LQTVNDRAAIYSLAIPIAAVERDTGLSKDTLRVWERRYGFPAPRRDAFGERAYPIDQVEKLRAIKRLLDVGHRPGRIVAMDLQALQSLSEPDVHADALAAHGENNALDVYMDFIKSHDAEGLRRALAQVATLQGATALVCDVVAPLNAMVGNSWLCGQLEIFEEHLYTESVRMVLHNAICNMRCVEVAIAAAQPRVLLTTFPQEPHGLGLLMAEVMLVQAGCQCVSLGTQTPVWDIVLAAAAQGADVVALSFTDIQNANDVVNGLQELRQKLAPDVAIWVGGSSAVITRRPVVGVTVLTDLYSIPAFVARWRARQGQQTSHMTSV
jgi:MerR family transcriptional regulator, light-induced transcriptional regulator